MSRREKRGGATKPRSSVFAGAAVLLGNEITGQLVRFWSDGAIDTTPVYLDPFQGVCEAGIVCDTIPLVPGTCITDIDRNGDTGINDFLTLLGGWGECP